jgi:hypothetical protein
MLPKIWKKVLLAICIIACLFNITSKLVNRISLEKVIASEQEGVNVKEILNITDEEPVVTNNNNTISTYDVEDNQVINEENIDEEQVEEENSTSKDITSDIKAYITDTSKYEDFLQN